MKTLKIELDKIGFKITEKNGKKFLFAELDERFTSNFERKDGTTGISLNLVINELKTPRTSGNWSEIEFVKPNLSKDVSKEERDNVPIIGNIQVYNGAQQQQSQPVKTTITKADDLNDAITDDDLPF